MTAINAKVQELATMFGVSTTDARLFADLVLVGMNKGLTLEAAIERGRRVLVQMLDNVNRNPKAARALVTELHADLAGVAP